jgi:hypothetical protein
MVQNFIKIYNNIKQLKCLKVYFQRTLLNSWKNKKQFIRTNYPGGKMFPGQLMLLHVKNTPLKLFKERKGRN